jgi:mono/diheme cytochrome c family protein
MKRILLLALICLASASFAAAQISTITTDVLGAHLNYGRGCAACHAPHSGVYGNGNAKTADPSAGDTALWGEDVSSLYGQTITSGGGGYVETLPTSMNAVTPDVSGLLTCLSCHDGNYATGAMMKNAVYETLPSSYGKLNTIPTLLGNDGTTIGNYLNDHPVGLAASVGCGGQYNWDCTISATGAMQMNGAASSKFVTDYGFFVSLGAYNNQPVVMCTTCHNQHLMNMVKVTTGPKSGLPSGTYATMFFIRAPYNPADQVAGSNQTAQFCRQCHGGESNEMNGSTAVTIF